MLAGFTPVSVLVSVTFRNGGSYIVLSAKLSSYSYIERGKACISSNKVAISPSSWTIVPRRCTSTGIVILVERENARAIHAEVEYLARVRSPVCIEKETYRYWEKVCKVFFGCLLRFFLLCFSSPSLFFSASSSASSFVGGAFLIGWSIVSCRSVRKTWVTLTCFLEASGCC